MMEKSMTRRIAHGATFAERWSRRACVAAFLAGIAASPALSQSFEIQDSSENIADSEISVGDEQAAEHLDDLLQSIEDLRASIDRVKIITNTERIDVVYLRDMIESAPAELEQAIEENNALILELQKGLEASAIFYNALMSQEVNIPDVVSIRLDEPNATIYVRGVAPDQGVAIEDAPADPAAPADAPEAAGDDAEPDATAPEGTAPAETTPDETAPVEEGDGQ
jgi:TolA-binding protein